MIRIVMSSDQVLVILNLQLRLQPSLIVEGWLRMTPNCAEAAPPAPKGEHQRCKALAM